MKLSDFDADAVAELLASLRAEAADFVSNCDPEAPIRTEYKVYMRYTGQGWEIPVSLTDDQAAHPDAQTFLELFEADYTSLFGRTVTGMDVEITVWAANATTGSEAPEPVGETPDRGLVTPETTRPLFDPVSQTMSEANVVARASLSVGDRVAGPALIYEDETTIVVPASRTATARPDGSIDISEVQP